VKAIVSSGYANDAVIANFKKYGFSGIVTKPYNITELEKTLRDVMYPPASAKISQKNSQPLKSSGTRKTKILVMDDTQLILNALGEYLPDLGYEVEFAKNGDDAISLYTKALNSGHLFDVVLVDLHIAQGLGGEDTIQRLIAADPNVRAIVTSGYPAEAAMVAPQKFGFKAAITKPYRIEELGEIIQKVLQGESNGEGKET
jgi:CheY-like chemotaxis protein